MKCKVFSGKDRVSGISVAKQQYSANKEGVFDLPPAVVNEISDKFRLEPITSIPAPVAPAQKKGSGKDVPDATPAAPPDAPPSDVTGNAPDAPQGPTPPPEK